MVHQNGAESVLITPRVLTCRLGLYGKSSRHCTWPGVALSLTKQASGGFLAVLLLSTHAIVWCVVCRTDVVAEQACIADNDMPGRASLINLGAPHLLPSHHAPSAAHNVFLWQRGQAYSVLVQLVSALGWDEFLAVRSELTARDRELRSSSLGIASNKCPE